MFQGLLILVSFQLTAPIREHCQMFYGNKSEEMMIV